MVVQVEAPGCPWSPSSPCSPSTESPPPEPRHVQLTCLHRVQLLRALLFIPCLSHRHSAVRAGGVRGGGWRASLARSARRRCSRRALGPTHRGCASHLTLSLLPPHPRPPGTRNGTRQTQIPCAQFLFFRSEEILSPAEYQSGDSSLSISREARVPRGRGGGQLGLIRARQPSRGWARR
jgi:hypothetical protein